MNEKDTLTKTQYLKDEINQTSIINSLIKTNFEISPFPKENLKTDQSTNSQDKIHGNSQNSEDEEEYIKRTLCSRQNQIIFLIMAFFLLILLCILYLI
jgi:hypothetical protein